MQDVTLDGLDPALRRRVQRMLRGTLGRASTSAPAAAVAADSSLSTVIDAAPALSATAGFKDRRKAEVRELDQQALGIVETLRAQNVEGLQKTGRGKLSELLVHPVLLPMLLKVRHSSVQPGDWSFVMTPGLSHAGRAPQRAGMLQQGVECVAVTITPLPMEWNAQEWNAQLSRSPRCP